MKITKRQLKRIIREEYSKLMRRSLIREGSERAIYDAFGASVRNAAQQAQSHPFGSWQRMWREELWTLEDAGYSAEEVYKAMVGSI